LQAIYFDSQVGRLRIPVPDLVAGRPKKSEPDCLRRTTCLMASGKVAAYSRGR
jgi:hypothetical protein